MVDIIVVLGDSVNAKQGLSEEQKKRIDHGLELFRKKEAKYLLFCGGFGKHFNTTKTSLAKHMKIYALQKGIPNKKIILESRSFNTIENIIFAKQILDKIKFKKILIVSSDWHIPRVKLICRYIFGKNYSISFSSVRVEKSSNSRILRWEAAARKRDKCILTNLKTTKKLTAS